MNEHTIEVTEATFERDVIERSARTAVLVDFWAPWCGPCRALGPVLEQEVSARGGDVVLAKVNSDENQGLARRYQIQGIPACKLFVKGEVVGEFVGALPPPKVRSFLAEHVPSELDELLAELDASDAPDEEIRGKLESALANHPDHAGLHLRLARFALGRGDAASVARHVEAIEEDAPEAADAAALQGALGFALTCQEYGGIDKARAAARDGDLAAQYAFASCLAAAGDYEPALEAFLAVVTKDRKFQDGAAHQAMLTIFNLVGVRSDLADRFRRELLIVL